MGCSVVGKGTRMSDLGYVSVISIEGGFGGRRLVARMITIPKAIGTNRPAAILRQSTDVSRPAWVVTCGYGVSVLSLDLLPTFIVPPLLGAGTGAVFDVPPLLLIGGAVFEGGMTALWLPP
jgi:hypothetical protein